MNRQAARGPAGGHSRCIGVDMVWRARVRRRRNDNRSLKVTKLVSLADLTGAVGICIYHQPPLLLLAKSVRASCTCNWLLSFVRRISSYRAERKRAQEPKIIYHSGGFDIAHQHLETPR
ncbi:hypothetical protein EI94DRAFT_227623 [Lactarius quietus]|nr:hypothetical protein EI94DRAFT_227623 [Lactarius quietus]